MQIYLRVLSVQQNCFSLEKLCIFSAKRAKLFSFFPSSAFIPYWRCLIDLQHAAATEENCSAAGIILLNYYSERIAWLIIEDAEVVCSCNTKRAINIMLFYFYVMFSPLPEKWSSKDAFCLMI
jgi:hypothetical protein